MRFKLSLSFFGVFVISGIATSQFVYPETESNDNRRPQGHMRQPVTSNKCAEGELLYPGDNDGDWTCDCRPTFIYYPQTAKCYPIYTKGPCKPNQILNLPKSKIIPVCERNACADGKVMYNNVCSELESAEACKQPSKGSKTHRLSVNPTTLQLNCTFVVSSRVGEEDNAESYESNVCFLGSKRYQEGLCQITLL